MRLLLPAILLAAVAWVAGLTPVSAADQVRIESVEIGLEGRLKVGRWTPVRVQVSGPAGVEVTPTIIAPDPDGSATTWTLPAVTLNGAQPQESLGLFQVGRVTGTLRVEAGDAARSFPIQSDSAASTAESVHASRQSVTFIGVLGPAEGFDQAFAADSGASTAQASRVIRFPSAADLPTSREAYDVLNVLVLSQTFDLDAPRSDALAGWVRGGGHLVLAFGGEPDAYLSSSVSGWAPVTAAGAMTVSDVASVVDRVMGAPPLSPGRGIPGVRIEAPAGVELASSSLRGPLIVRSAYGLGRVTAFALDWTQPPLSTWKGLPGLCRYLADAEGTRARSEGPSGSQLRPTGVSELATQLAGQLDHFPQVQRPSYWTVIGLAAAFLLLVGPLDYLLVHRLLKQPRLTWITFPVWVTIAALSGNAVANRINPSDRHANQVTLLDADADTGLVRVQSWMTIYSPAPQRYEVEAEVADWVAASTAPNPAPVMSWSGTPEADFRGMYRAGGLDLANAPYSITENRGSIENLPIGYASSKAVQAEWRSIVSPDQPIVESDLAAADDGSGRLQGTLTHFCPDAITDYCLAYRNFVYVPRATAVGGRAPSLPPGLAWNPQETIQPRILDRYLKGITYRYVEDENRKGHEGVPNQREYDPLGLDSLNWARILTFHDVTGGPQYTTLTNHALQDSDLSPLLEVNRAVLFGRIASPAATLNVDGETAAPEQQWTFVRLIIPVRPASAGSQ